MSYFVILASFLSSLFFLYSLYIEKDSVSLAAFSGSIVVFLLTIRDKYKNRKKTHSQNQEIKDKSFGIQAGGDVSIDKKD